MTNIKNFTGNHTLIQGLVIHWPRLKGHGNFSVYYTKLFLCRRTLMNIQWYWSIYIAWLMAVILLGWGDGRWA